MIKVWKPQTHGQLVWFLIQLWYLPWFANTIFMHLTLFRANSDLPVLELMYWAGLVASTLVINHACSGSLILRNKWQ